MRVLLRGGGFVNKGAEAMLLTVKAELTRRIPQARFVLPADCIHSDAEAGDAGGHGFEIQAVPPATPWRLAGAAVRAAARAPRQAGDLWRKRSEAFETLALLDGVDAVVDVHGYAFGDPWPPKYVLRTAAYVTHCRQQGKPYVFMPQSWGPFERETTRAGYRWLCTGSALYYARDDTSRDYLAELLACDAVQIRQSPDIVFLFDPADHGGAAGDPFRRPWTPSRGRWSASRRTCGCTSGPRVKARTTSTFARWSGSAATSPTRASPWCCCRTRSGHDRATASAPTIAT